MASLLAFITAEVLPTDIYAEFLKSRLAPDQVFYSPFAQTQKLAQSLCSKTTAEVNWSGNISHRLEEAKRNSAVHIVTQREFEVVFEELLGRRAEREIVVEGTKEVPIVTERREWEWFCENWKGDTGEIQAEIDHTSSIAEEKSGPSEAQTPFCIMRELPPTDQYRLYVLNLSPSPLSSASLWSTVGATSQELLSIGTLPPGPSVVLYPGRPQGQVYLSLWTGESALCGLWVS